MDITGFLNSVNTGITTVTAADSISPSIVGSAFSDIANLTKTNVDAVSATTITNTASISDITTNGLRFSNIDTTITGGTAMVADANQFKKVNDLFTTLTTPVVLFNGATDTALSVSINEGASKIWAATNRCVIVPVIAGHSVKVEGRSSSALTKTIVWLTSNDHTLGATPFFAFGGTFAASSVIGDATYTVPVGASYMYVISTPGDSTVLKVTDLTGLQTKLLLDSALPSSVSTGVSGNTAAIATLNGYFNTVNNPIELYNGSTGTPLTVSINEGASKIWVATNRSVVVPVVAGRSVSVTGRSGSTLSKTIVWLTGNDSTLGATPAFLTGNFNTSFAVGDATYTVPSGATYMYVLWDTQGAVGAAIRITDLTGTVTTVLKDSSLPISVTSGLTTHTNDIASLKSSNKLIVTKYTDVVVGRDCNIYMDAISTAPDNGNINNITAYSSNSTIVRGVKNIKYKPTSGTTGIDTIFTLRDYNFNVQDSKTKTFRTVVASGGTGTKRIMFLGDSYIDIGLIAAETYSLLATDGDYTITQLGTRTGQQRGAKIEGYSGWAWNNFVNLDSATVGGVLTTNPFRTGGTLNIPAYFSAQGYSGIDVLVINLGVNDFGFTGSIITDAQIATVIGYAKTFMNAFLAAYPSLKIILNLPTVGALGSFPTNTAVQEYRKNGIARGAAAYIANFDNGAFNANVVLCDASQWVDRTNGFSVTNVASADRLTSLTENRFTDPVHPNTAGFYQIADAVYSKIRSVFAGNIG